MFHIMSKSSSQKSNFRRLGVIGYGAVGAEIVHCLEARNQLNSLVGILDLPERLPELTDQARGQFPLVGALDELLAFKPDIVIEAAGHAAVKRFGSNVMARGD